MAWRDLETVDETSARDLGEHFDALFRSSSDCLFLVEPDDSGALVYVAVNDAGQKHLPVPWVQARGRTPRDVLGGEAGETISSRLEAVFSSGEIFTYQPVFTMAAGETVFDAVYTPVRSASGAVTGVMGVARDITLQRRLSRALAAPDRPKMSSPAVSFAEEVSALVGHVGSCLDHLRNPVAPGIREVVISEGLRSAAHSNRLLGELLASQDAGAHSLAEVDVRPLLRRLPQLLGDLIEAVPNVQLSLATDLRSALIDPGVFETALLGLVIGRLVDADNAFAIEVEASAPANATAPDEPDAAGWIEITVRFRDLIPSMPASAVAEGRFMRQHRADFLSEIGAVSLRAMGARVHRSKGPEGQVARIRLPAA